MAIILSGPWAAAGLLTWYATVDDGRSAWSVHGRDLREAAMNAYLDLRAELVAGIAADDPFALDSAEQAAQALADTKLRVMTPSEWDSACLHETVRRWDVLQRVVPADAQLPVTGGAA